MPGSLKSRTEESAFSPDEGITREQLLQWREAFQFPGTEELARFDEAVVLEA